MVAAISPPTTRASSGEFAFELERRPAWADRMMFASNRFDADTSVVGSSARAAGLKG